MSAISTCNLCLHWSVDLEQGPRKIGEPAPGHCHRYPPAVFAFHLPQGVQIRTQYPQPHSDFWCGEFVPREAH